MRRMRALIAVLLCLLTIPHALAQTTDPLMGLWAFEAEFPAALRGELTVRRSEKSWRANIGGRDAPGTVDGSELRFAFSDGNGFRGRLLSDGKAIEGFWLQPSGEAEGRPWRQAFATPARLKHVSRDVWRGSVVPYDDGFTLYLSIFQDQDGMLTAAFRNPQRNSTGGASRFAVTRKGDALRFNLKYEGGEINHDAMFLRSPDRIRIQWDDLKRPIDLTRRHPAQAASFFPRVPGAPVYIYRRPAEIGDGWRTAAAGELGIDEAAVTGAVRSIIESDPTARPATLMHSVLVAYRGRLVLEEYFFGYGRDTAHDIRSAGKTFSSVMLGAAMREGANLSPDSRITQVMHGLAPFANPDPRKDRITLSHLLTHSAGLACNDNDDNSPGNENIMDSQNAQPNWWKYTLDLPMVHDPGKRYAYCSGNINLAGGALTVGARTWLPELFERTVARPLQFGRWHWNLMPNGEGYLGGGARLRPRDLLKVGQVFLNGGTWNGRRIVDASWVSTSTRPQMPITPETTGYSAEDFGNYYGGGADALAWHQNNLSVSGRTVEGYAASGNGGQVLLVVPEYQLAAVFTGGNYGQGFVWTRWAQQIIGDKIIPAIRPPR